MSEELIDWIIKAIDFGVKNEIGCELNWLHCRVLLEHENALRQQIAEAKDYLVQVEALSEVRLAAWEKANEQLAEAQARIAKLEAANRWIPVGERLPKLGEEIFYIDDFGEAELMTYKGFREGQFTYWMPASLPKPPEEV